MTAPWRKAIRDFWQERTRSLLVVLAIAMGIAAFLAIMASYAILVRELNHGYLATNPASATIRVSRVDDALVRAVLADKRISDAEPRRAINGRIKVGPAEWRNLAIFVVADYAKVRVSKLVPQAGAWPPAVGEILVERDAFQVAKAKIGDTVTVKTIDGTEQQLRVSGSVHDVGQAQARMENSVYGYVGLDTLKLLGEQPYLDQLKILVANDRDNEAHIRTVVADVKQGIESQGYTVRSVDIPAPGKHPHADIMGLLLLAKSSFGIFVLLLSGILVVNLLTAMMAAQVRQIGVMKAIGGTRTQIAKIYFAQAWLLGVAALAIALPLGLLGARWLCQQQSKFLNFDVTSFAVPPWVFLLVGVVGVLVPLLAAAWPVWKGSGMSVREALADYGVTQTRFGTGRLERALINVGGVTRPFLLAVRNSFRRRTRLVLTLLTLAAGGLFFMSALNVRASMIHTLDELFSTRRFDLQVSMGGMYPVEKINRAIANTPGVRYAEAWFVTQAAFTSPAAAANDGQGHGSRSARTGHGGATSGANSFVVIALPADSRMMQRRIVAGRDLRSEEVDAIVVNHNLAARHPEMQVGKTVRFQMGPAETAWRVVGVAREPFSPPLAYIPQRFIEARHPGSANALRLQVDRTDPAGLNAIKASLDENLAKEGIRALGSMSLADSRFGFDQHMVMIYVFLIVTAAIIASVGGLGLATTMSLNVMERRREMGVLRALGATPRMVWLIIVAEGTMTAVLSWAVAGVLAWPVSKALGDLILRLMFRTNLDFAFDVRGLAAWFVISIVLGAVASFLPAWSAARRPVREAIAYE